MVELSERTASHVRLLFSADHVADAIRLLREECADKLPIVGSTSTPSSLERIRFAALRLSGGDIGRLRYAIELANADWRDLLVAAEFADDVHAHETWQPMLLDAATIKRWHR